MVEGWAEAVGRTPRFFFFFCFFAFRWYTTGCLRNQKRPTKATGCSAEESERWLWRRKKERESERERERGPTRLDEALAQPAV